ncbi:MAG: carbohydrate ABC transporter permease [Acutalibacteraceae bacterium]
MKRRASVKNTYSLKSRIYQNRVYYLMLLPFMLLFFMFTILPVLSSVVLSFTSFDMFHMPRFAGADNYIRMFLEDDIFIKALKNTLLFAVITGPVGYILSFVVAWLINELPRSVRSFITLIMYAPSLAGNVFYIWTFIFAGDSKGLINTVLIQSGIISDPIKWLTDTRYSFGVVLVVVIWMSLGAGFLSFVAGFQSLDRSYFEAAAIDGVRNRFQEMYYITFPQMAPQLLFGAVMSISQAFAVGNQCTALTGFPSTNYSTHTLLLHMLDYGKTRFEMGYASAIAVVLFLIMMLSWLGINKLLKHYSTD